MYSALLFDLGDTLIDFEPMDTRALFRRAARGTYDFLQERFLQVGESAGGQLPPFETYCARHYRSVRWAYFWAKLRGREFNSLELLRQFCANSNLPVDEPALEELAWRWYQPLTERTSVEEGLPELLSGFRDSGLKLAIISNTFVPGSAMDKHLEMFGLREFFPVRIYSSEVRFRKPDPRIFQIALEGLRVKASESVFVGDLLKTDIVGARQSGIKAILKQPWGTTRAHHRADAVIRRLGELPEVLRRLGDRSSAAAAKFTSHLQLQPPPEPRHLPVQDADDDAPLAALS